MDQQLKAIGQWVARIPPEWQHEWLWLAAIIQYPPNPNSQIVRKYADVQAARIITQTIAAGMRPGIGERL